MIIAANLKCNHTRASFAEFSKILENFLCENTKITAKNEILVFPPFSALSTENFSFSQGVQNFYPCENGSFTGEIGEKMLKEFGINSVLIGHSERREILGETDELIVQKFNFAKRQNYKIIFCIGESDVTRMNGNYREFLSSQLENIDLNYENLVIAYEPIWAIGTSKSANISQIAEILEFLGTKTKAPLLYGGSVNAKNIAEISQIPHCGGVLIGSASWKIENFTEILKTATI